MSQLDIEDSWQSPEGRAQDPIHCSPDPPDLWELQRGSTETFLKIQASKTVTIPAFEW